MAPSGWERGPAARVAVKRLLDIRALVALAVLATAAAVAVACDSADPGRSSGAYPIDIFQEMHYNQGWKAQEPPRELPPEGSVPISGGKLPLPEDAEAIEALTNPVSANDDVLNHAAHLYAINCAMCHGPLGGGDGNVGLHFEEYAGVLPPAFDSERIRELSEGRAYASITQGFGLMPAFGNLLSDDDRWALVHLIFTDPGMRAAFLSDPSNQAPGGGPTADQSAS